MNFETVKYFTAESYEVEQFSDTVKRYQRENVAVEASVSLLNVLQSLLFQACLFTSLSLTAIDIKGKIDCCVQNGCDALNSTCCATISNCPGMSVGDFVAVLAYVMQLFVPLNFLGGIYQAIIMATVDLSNLLDILALMPEVRDAQDAMPLSTLNTKDPEVAVEFDHVYFHYPAQDSSQGVKNVSFKMKKGTVTAIVGHTGSGEYLQYVLSHGMVFVFFLLPHK
jgi:ABC-type transport system involved in Fe-S cluster assembly fused permease/ATPase subunit